MSANKLPAADEDSFCAKRGKIRSETARSQAAVVTSRGICFPTAGPQQGNIFVIADLAFDFQINRFK